MHDAAAPPPPEQPVRITPADAEARPTPVIFASPHSGGHYPADMAPAAGLAPAAIRRSEDAHVDALLEAAPALGVELVCATYGRAYVDVNRAPEELDPAMFHDAPKAPQRLRSARVAAGLGSIPRVAGEGLALYDRKLGWAEAQRRIAGVHRPYHSALGERIAAKVQAHELAVLVDWHSMPSAAVRGAPGDRLDFVLGDRFGASCDRQLSDLIARALKGMGYRVAHNAPYAGGYTTEHYGDPAGGVHVLQIEMNRALYLDEVTMAPHGGFALLRAALEQLTGALATESWPGLTRRPQKNRARWARL